MRRRYLLGALLAGGIALVIAAVAVVAVSATRPPGKLTVDTDVVSLSGLCVSGFDRVLTLHNTGDQPVQWHAPALSEADVTAIASVPASGTLQPGARQMVHIQGHTLRGGFTVLFQWQGSPVGVQFSCNGPM